MALTVTDEHYTNYSVIVYVPKGKLLPVKFTFRR